MYFLNKKQQNKSINKKLLVVQLNHKKDLQIQWNFSGMLMPKAYRRHVFISLSSEKAQVLKAYNKTRACFQYFKFGDLYTFGNPSDRNLAWFEKTKIDPFRSSFCMQSMKNQLNQQYQTYRQLKSLSKFKQPCLVVLFCDPQQQVSQVERFLAAIKQKCNLSIFVFVISAHYHQSSIDYANGIFKLAQKNSSIEQIESIYKQYNDHLACVHAKVVLQSVTGDIFIEQGVWMNHSFTNFSRTINYPLATEFTDTLQINSLYSEKVRQWKFIMKLQYKLLNGQIFSDSKQIIVPLYQNIQKYITSNYEVTKVKTYCLYNSVQLESNPFTKTTRIESGIGFTNI